MTSLLSSHLEQIHLCANSIATLPFAGPKPFSSALLSPTHDITALIRDTEQHERALFHLAPPPLPPTKAGSSAPSVADSTTTQPTTTRRQTTYGGARQPKNKAVAAVLGGDLYRQTRGAQKGDLDVELLLRGAEKLAAVYPIPGANDKITALRRRHQQLAANIAHYEERVAEQTRELRAMKGPAEDLEDEEGLVEGAVQQEGIPLTKEDLEGEEEEVKELERKKKGLEERVEGMERDLGGLMR